MSFLESLSAQPYFPAGLMLGSAIIHAFIGVTLKRAKDKLVMRNLLSWFAALYVLPWVFFVQFPSAQAWGYLLIGAIAHCIYQVGFVRAFERADMSVVYPVMRGVAPALAAGFAFLFLDEGLNGVEALGLAIAVIALLGFGWPMKKRPAGWLTAMGFAILCGAMTALYAVIDAGGMRLTRELTGVVWGYMVWFFLIDGIGLSVLVYAKRKGRVLTAIKAEWRLGAIAGGYSLLSFGLALYAFSIAPIAQMAAMRETSVVFGAILAAFLLKEPFGGRRIALAVVLAFGLILMQTA